jgi:PadR family transcriptional regulator
MPRRKAKTEPTSELPEARLHGELLSTSLLAFLKNWNAYGYELSQRLEEAGMPQFDSGTVYRTLRQLEKGGMVDSFWDTSRNGPARRMYSLTKAGDMFLSAWIDILQNYQLILRQALADMEPRQEQTRRRTRKKASSTS